MSEMFYKILLLVLWIIITHFYGIIGAKLSGIDNVRESPNHRQRHHQASGNDNNDNDNGSNSDTRKPLEGLSKVFGISRIPNEFHGGTPPEYMVKLFSEVAYEDGITKHSAPYDANIVHGMPDRALHHQILYKFNVSHIQASENILEAEFHIFKVIPRLDLQHRSEHVILLKLYQILDPNHPENVTLHRHLLYQRQISAHARGWEKFSVAKTVKQWIANESTNYGFYLETSSLRNGALDEELYFRFAQKSEQHDSKQPLLVIFTDDKNHISNEGMEIEDNIQDNPEAAINSSNDDISALRRQYVKFLNEGYREQQQRSSLQKPNINGNIMSAELHTRLTALSNNNRDASSREISHNRRDRQKRAVDYSKFHRRRKKTCSLHELYVDFEEIGWSGWIISPKGYSAFHCKGACQFPLGQSQQPTNHATVQSIVTAFRGGRDVGPPCCVPNKLYSISLLYFDDQENVILKQYDDMVASSCGCH